MAVTSLNDIDADDVIQAEATLTSLVRGEFPSLDLSRGTVLRDLVLRPAAVYHTINQTDMNLLRQSFSLKNISDNPTLATDAIVDGVLSNLLITRDSGSYATGQVRIIVSSLNTTSVPQGTTFTANGKSYEVDRSYLGVTSQANVTSASTKLMQSRADGNYEFIVDATASDTGVDSNIQSGTRFTVSPTIPRMIDASAADDFTGGLAQETNAELVARAQLGISAQVLSGRTHIESLLRENFSSIKSASIVGFGDAEMRRDRNNVFGLSTGGKTDIYVRTADYPQTISTSVTATLVDKTAGTWQFTLGRTAAAGVYKAVGVYRSGTSPAAQLDGSLLFLDSLAILSHSRGLDLSAIDNDFIPTINSASEGAFSRYQTVTVQFTDTQSAATADPQSTATYTAYLYKMPDIAAIQDFINDRSRRNPGADYLVRAPIPLVCAATVNVLRRNAEVTIATTTIQQTVSTAINSLGFSVGYLPSSKIVAAAEGLLEGTSTLDLPVDISGVLWKPDDTVTLLSESDELNVPSNLESLSITSRTVGFYLAPKDVTVNVTTMSTLEV